jgi:diguanylate cyclase (GGDEF)-like protein
LRVIILTNQGDTILQWQWQWFLDTDFASPLYIFLIFFIFFIVYFYSIRDAAKDKAQCSYLQSIIDGVKDAIMVIDTNYTVTLMNNTVKESLDPSFIRDIENPKCYEISHLMRTPCDESVHPCPLHQAIEKKKVIYALHRHNNNYVELTATPILTQSNNVSAIIVSAHNITQLLETQQKLKNQTKELSHLASHDSLTKLPNRVLFIDRLTQSIKVSQREKSQLAVLFIDLDLFKEINDSLGHDIGDKVLITISERLKLCIRKSDTVARMGGDEYTIIIGDIRNKEIITEIISKVLLELSKPLIINQHKLFVTSSIGVSLYPGDGDNATELLKNADAAMYRAKSNGRNNYYFYKHDSD